MDIALFILVHRYLHRVLLRHVDRPLLSPPLSYVTCASYYVTLPHCIFWDREFLLFTTFLPPFLPAFRSSCIAPRFQSHYPILKAASFSSTIAENSFSVRAAFFKFQIETPDDESLFNRYFVRIFSSLSCFFSFLFSDTTLIRFTRDDNAADLLTPPLPAPLPPFPRGNELSTKSNHRPPASAGSRRRMPIVRHYLSAALSSPK